MLSTQLSVSFRDYFLSAIRSARSGVPTYREAAADERRRLEALNRAILGSTR